METRTFIVKAMTGWTEKEIMKSLAKDHFKEMEYISGIGTKAGKVKVTVKVERTK